MQSWAQDSYLTTEVMTAAPQKLQLMLIEAAIRFAQRARQQWKAGECESACEALIRAQDIVGHILAGLGSSSDRELAKKVASVYLFVFRSFMEANVQRDEKKLDDAVRVLEVERETWRQVCAQLGTTRGGESPAAQGAFPGPSAGAPVAPALHQPSDVDVSYTGFSLEA